ncbi:GIY-YIG nuclease family protein [Youhaiella tibetensis]|uniref:GIY-YIG nuclease family protein n=1 Tax=Paradevosia tibetensis TaxID=1447062 RepID=UPI001582EC8C|nr:GIY-YIG nuclease family protein [Youhaiella tibetensis]
MSAVVEGITLTADKIRALLQEGYLRADIARFLGVRYQHVRGVAVAAGIEDGLQRGIVVVPKSKPAPKVTKDVAIDVLVDAGFTLLGTWIASDAGIGLSTPAPHDPGVYAFVVDGVVKYIGLTKSSFHRRMYNYQRPGATQSTSIRINQTIADHVAAGRVVEVYVAIPPPLEWNGLPIHSSAGLEAGLIEMIQPPWNKMGVASTGGTKSVEGR